MSNLAADRSMPSFRQLFNEYEAVDNAISEGMEANARDLAKKALEVPLAAVRPIFSTVKPADMAIDHAAGNLSADMAADMAAETPLAASLGSSILGKALASAPKLSPLPASEKPVVTPVPQVPKPEALTTSGLVHPAVAIEPTLIPNPGISVPPPPAAGALEPIGVTLEDALSGARPLGGSKFELGMGTTPGPDLIIPTELESRMVVSIPGYGYVHRHRLLKVVVFLIATAAVLGLAGYLSTRKGKAPTIPGT